MNEFLMTALEHAAAAVSLLLMGACGVGLALRLLRVLRGQEAADGLTRRSVFAPGASLLAAAGVGLLSRLALYGLAYAMYRLLGVGNDGRLNPWRRCGRTGTRATTSASRRRATRPWATSGCGWCSFRCTRR